MIFTQCAKYWAVEIRFSRILTEREQRTLLNTFYGVSVCNVGQDGAMIPQWPDKWPGADDDAIILEAVRKIGAPARVRAAPFGRDCDQRGDERCDIGSVNSCNPIFTDGDWRTIDPLATENP